MIWIDGILPKEEDGIENYGLVKIRTFTFPAKQSNIQYDNWTLKIYRSSSGHLRLIILTDSAIYQYVFSVQKPSAQLGLQTTLFKLSSELVSGYDILVKLGLLNCLAP